MSERSLILVVDDEPALLRAMSPSLVAAGYAVQTAETGAAAIAAVASQGVDAVVLDLGLPDMDGKAVIDRVREWSQVPILVLTARDAIEEKIDALDRGADDYVAKPFAMPELLARLRVALRHAERRHLGGGGVLEAQDLTVDFATRRVFLMGEEISLTPREYDLMRTLARHAGQIVTYKQILSAVWGANPPQDNQFVRVLIGQLRQKVEKDPSSPRLILTETRLGYRLNA